MQEETSKSYLCTSQSFTVPVSNSSLASSIAASELRPALCLLDLEHPLDLDLDLVLEQKSEGVRLGLLPRGGVLEPDRELHSLSEELLSSLILEL